MHTKQTRDCPKCKKELTYSSQIGYSLALRHNSLCRSCSASEINNRPEIHKLRTAWSRNYAKTHPNGFLGKHHTPEYIARAKARDRSGDNNKTPEFRELMSKITSGKNNGMYGKTFYQQWVSKYGQEEADRRMAAHKLKQSKNSSGKNNSMFGKPSPQGAGSGWSGWYNGWFFRSILELSYMINIIEKGNKKWSSAERKDLSIKYINWNGVERTYRADFLIDDKYLIECKPKKLFNTPSNKLKREAAEKFCEEKGLIYKMVSAPKMSTDDLIKLYRGKKIKFTENYDRKFKQKYYKDEL